MEEKKKRSNIFIIILFILLMISVGVIGYLLGSHSVKDNNNVEENQVEENNKNVEEENKIEPVNYSPKCKDGTEFKNTLMSDIDVTEYNNIFEYIQNQENVKITIDYCKKDANDPQADADGLVRGTYELTRTERENVFKEMANSSIKIRQSGLGGACVQSLEISYERKNKTYYVSYYGLFAMSSNDGNIYKILDESVNNTLEEPQNCFYSFDNLSSTAKSITNGLTGN